MQVIKTIALQAANNTAQRIREQAAWFYLRHMNIDEGTPPSTAFHALLTRKERESLPAPQGEKEKAVRGQLCTRSALLEAQLYDTINAYIKLFIMSTEDIPTGLRYKLNSDLTSFNEQTTQALMNQSTICIRQNSTADQMAKELLLVWDKASKRLADDIDGAYIQASWYYLLHQFDKAGYHKFQYIVEHQQGLCNTCLSFSNKTFTLNELIQQDLLPPLHPHCRCAVIPVYESSSALEQPVVAASPNADNHANWYDALLRIPSDAKALLNGFAAAQQERIGRGTLGGFLDWLTMGAVSGLYEGLKTRTDAMTKDPSLYHIVNWLTLGTADMVKGAFSPDEPLSLEHWLNSLGVASIAVSAYELAQSISQPTFRAIQESPSTPNAPERAVKRPTWRQTELDGVTDYPDHLPQQSFLHGEVVPYGTKGSVRPDFYRPGSSVDYKNYNISTPSKRNNLVRNIRNQYFRRELELPPNTQQTFVMDIRGQIITDDILDQLYDKIIEQTSPQIIIYFKVQ